MCDTNEDSSFIDHMLEAALFSVTPLGSHCKYLKHVKLIIYKGDSGQEVSSKALLEHSSGVRESL